MSPDAVYLVFEFGDAAGGEFVKYRQFEVLAYGRFAFAEYNIYALFDAIHLRYAIHLGNTIYLISSTGEVTVFTRLVREPTFINVQRPDF